MQCLTNCVFRLWRKNYEKYYSCSFLYRRLFGCSDLGGECGHLRASGVYVGGTLVKANQMNQGAKYATPDKPIEVTTADSYYQQDGKYLFKVGYFMHIKTEQAALSTMLFYNSIAYGATQDAILQIKPKPTDATVVGYTNGVWTIAIHQSISLKEGANDITLKLDSNNVIEEINEQNNIYKFKVTFKK